MPENNMINDPEIDPILSAQNENELLPSAGFVANVMDAVRREAAAPPPIPFPWKRALAGLALVVAALGLLAALGVFTGPPHAAGTAAPHVAGSLSWSLAQGLQEKVEMAAIWTALALLGAFVTVKLSMRLAVGRT